MKKSMLLFGMLAIMPAFAEGDYDYRYSSSCPECKYSTVRAVKTKSSKTTGRKSGYRNIINNNFYYVQPNGYRYNYGYKPNYQSEDYATEYYVSDYREYADVERAPVKKSYSNKMRKYFLAHPFFQPSEGRFGSVTDVYYTQNNFKFDVLNGTVIDLDQSPNGPGLYGTLSPVLTGKQETTQFVVKEDISYGISDTLAIIGMAQYDSTKVSLKDWSDGSAENSSSDSGINVFGVGLQYRFVDSSEWIAMVSGYFQHQKDIANTLIGELKAGYKVNRTTFYGLGRLGYSDLTEGDVYGSFVRDDTGDWLMLSYKTDVSSVLYAELGGGVFSVINKYMTLNGELVYGSYDWHNQLSLKGAIGFQPGDNFALNLYASTALYDSAKGKVLDYMNYDKDPTGYPEDINGNPVFVGSRLLYTIGDYKIKNYNEWRIGVQAIFYF